MKLNRIVQLRGLLNKKTLNYIGVNISIVSILTAFLCLSNRYREGVLYDLNFLISVPSAFIFLVLSAIFRGMWLLNEVLNLMESYADVALIAISCIFYSFAIGLIQWMHYKRIKRRQMNK